MGAQSSTSPARIRIAVSACLLGERVRYDGEDKRNHQIMTLAEEFELLPFCPEVAIGLGVPRPPVHLVRGRAGIHVRGVTDPELDVTDQLQAYAQTQRDALKTCTAVIFKSRSPSCGLGSTPLFNEQGNEVDKSSGLFAAELRECLPEVLMLEESDLVSEEECLVFIESLYRRG
ncbi:COG1683: Uncharacterized conserved protein / FIG143828: Hypothetical protein YbgA [hydrothermal vent metagenome]|uniref:Uncharacterized protein n=1 Tax=hydrothermal vent metagenome TaxID=652676 RepID=A0A3B1AWP8_9ZZZZ